jgi:RND family efflux transporter MFP subunit
MIQGARRLGGKLAVAAAVLAVAGGVGALAFLSRHGQADEKDAKPAPLEFQLAQITQPRLRRLSYDLVLPGTVQAISQATVRSRLSAVIRAVKVREGDPVAAGQVLAEFDTGVLRAQVAEREAGLASAKANLEQAQRTRDANAQLVQHSFITQSAFDTADATYQAQLANVAAAQAQLAQMQLQLDDAVVRAPIGGRVSRRYVQSGEKVGLDAPLLAIVDLAQLEVQAQAAVSDVARVQTGTPAEVRIEGLSDQKFSGRIERINPSADPGTRTIDLYVSFPNERDLVRAGMFANVRLHLVSDRDTATLPLTAVQTEAGQTIVWAIRDGRLVRRVVTVGRRDEPTQLVEILGGVEPGDRVLATRFDNLKEGGAVTIAAPSAVAPGSGPGVIGGTASR